MAHSKAEQDQQGRCTISQSTMELCNFSLPHQDLSKEGISSSILSFEGVLAFQLTDFIKNDCLKSLHERVLIRGVNVVNQAMSVGMAGWFEYGYSHALDRNIERLFDIMECLARDFALNDKFDASADVLRSLLTRCELNLPLYHPMTLMVSLDLAGALIMISQPEHAGLLLIQASHRLSEYLAEQERQYLKAICDWSSLPPEGKVIFRKWVANDFVSMLRSFVRLLEDLLERGFPNVLGPHSETVLLNHCFLGDSMTVLANCLAMEEIYPCLGNSPESALVWTRALKHYRTAFEGWAMAGRSLSHPSSVAAACGLCRCLRELGKLDHAIQILSMVVCATNPKPTREDLCASSGVEKAIVESPSITFLPASSRSSTKALQVRVTSGRGQSTALCLWHLAVYFMEANPNERGRIRALNLLHASSESLRRVLKDDESGHCRNRCALEMLQCVEDEARELFKPLKAAIESNPSYKDTNDGVGINQSTTKLAKKAWQSFQEHFSIA